MLDKIQSAATQIAPGIALIFDMDGVVIDSNPLHRRAWTEFNRRFGLETTDGMLERMYGKRNDEIVRDFFGALPDDEVIARGAAKEVLYREMLGERVDEVLVPGLKDFLARYPATPKALATNAEPQNVDFLLDRAGIRPLFQFAVNGSEVRHPKPHPEIYERAAELLHTKPANCVVFEDSYSGIEAARAAGTRIVGISTTHDNLPGTNLTVDNFWSRDLDQWLSDQRPIG